MSPPLCCLIALLLLVLAQGTFAQEPVLLSLDSDSSHVYIQARTSYNAQLAEEQSKATLQVLGTNLVDGLKLKFSSDCSDGSPGTAQGQDQYVLLYNVPSDPLSYFYGKQGLITLSTNQTKMPYSLRKVCMTSTPDAGDFSFNDTGLLVTIFDIYSVAGITAYPTDSSRITTQLRAYKYTTVIYEVRGIGLADRLQVSLQYSCKNNGLLIPLLGETPANLYGTNANGTVSYFRLSRAQTDLQFTTKDLCVSRGNPGHYDFSGPVGVTMTVFADCVESACSAGACHAPTGECLCQNYFSGQWSVCPGLDSNLTVTVNQTAPPADPLLCRHIKLGYYQPDFCASQMYTINPSTRDRFAIWCDMEGGGWSTFNATVSPAQVLRGGQPAQWLPLNVTYNITEQRLTDIRNVSLYGKQVVAVNCMSAYVDFSCSRDPYHNIHESVWLEWTFERLWPKYLNDGCCFECCYHTDHWRSSLASFWSLNLPIKNVQTFYGGADDNTDNLWFALQPMQFY